MTDNSSPVQFAASLQDIWCYYDTFLEQTLMLNAQPVRQLANNFNKLKVCRILMLLLVFPV